ncbi:hypothetical protein DLAC_05084 [Tieghemostelium lacteum]|uniref:Large ribosomal subunit protein mL52 n=1 Tax=Tieghemostelium lacteum TaxID=361077 RepID=A0A151ZIA2_TIELA|nr:hypothetical protein DLAC_05084 [Tieghemostelium lacteum]|eukprot:KYQ93696.1 hypothetical protein DLAC_05084 [Tieghemostelium lacteum]
MNIIRKSILQNRQLLNIYTRAGESYRLSAGKMRSGNEDGPLHDLPDFHFADGREVPLTETQKKWMKTRENEKNILFKIVEEAKSERQTVIDKIETMQEHINKSISTRKEKKSKKDGLFNKKSETTKSE